MRVEARNNLLTIIVVVFVLAGVTAGGLFYWYKVRPNDIREMCEEEKIANARPRPPWKETKTRVRTYDQCLEENGLDK